MKQRIFKVRSSKAFQRFKREVPFCMLLHACWSIGFGLFSVTALGHPMASNQSPQPQTSKLVLKIDRQHHNPCLTERSTKCFLNVAASAIKRIENTNRSLQEICRYVIRENGVKGFYRGFYIRLWSCGSEGVPTDQKFACKSVFPEALRSKQQ